MLSSDKNVESIAQLIEVLKHYLGLQAEYVKLDLIDKVASLLTAAALAIILFMIIVAVFLYFSFAFAFWISSFIGTAWAFLLVALLHVLTFILFLIYRKTWIEKPLIHFFATLFLSK